MKVSLATRSAALGALAALGLAACGTSSGGSAASGGTTTLTPQGSTFQQTIEQQWASDYQQQSPNVQVTYSGTGSSAGIEQFAAGKVPFAGSDVTMTTDEQSQADAACGSPALTLPITSGGIAIIYNLPGVSSLRLSAPTLAGIFMGTITKWDDPAIKADNAGASLPSTAITSFHRSDGSGTTDVLSGFLDAAAPSVWTLGVDKEFNWPSGQGAAGSSGVVAGVKSTAGGITYAEITYAKQSSLPTAAVKGASGSYVAISPESVAQSISSGFQVTATAPDLAGELSFDKMTGYPISTVSYVLACSKYANPATGAAVKGFLGYAAGAGQKDAAELGFAPLPRQLDQKVLTSLASIS